MLFQRTFYYRPALLQIFLWKKEVQKINEYQDKPKISPK